MSERSEVLYIRATRLHPAPRFAVAIMAVSLAPVCAFAIWGRSDRLQSPLAFLLALGISHVGTTAYFWLDQEYRGHINRRRALCYGWPTLVVAACSAASWWLGRFGLTAVIAVYTPWLLYHYGRQNWGLLCLISSAYGERPGNLERIILEWAPLGGIAWWASTLLAPHWPMWVIGAAIGTGALAAAAWTIVRLRPALPRALMLLLSAGFFSVPVWLGTNGLVAIGCAHGFQYVVMMLLVSGDKGWTRSTSIPLFALAFYTSFVVLSTHGTWVSVYYGLVMAHFLIDSGIWKLRDPAQRRTLQMRLPYLFPQTRRSVGPTQAIRVPQPQSPE